MNKQELVAENARLADENEALRELLAAVSLAAGTVPVSKDGDDLAEWRRSSRVLSRIKVLGALDGGWAGEIAYATRELRAIAAEPVGYEAYVRPEPVPDDEAAASAPEPPAVVAGEVVAGRVGMPEVMPVPQSHYCDSGNCEVCGDGTGDDEAADESSPCMMVGCGHDYDDHALDLERGDRLYCQRCECRRYLSAVSLRIGGNLVPLGGES